MNPRRKRQPFELWENQPIPKPSGGTKENWVKLSDPIKVSMFDQSAQNQLTFGSSGARIKQYDLLGLTSLKTLVGGKYQLRKDERIYQIKGVNNEGRLAQLFLVVKENGQ